MEERVLLLEGLLQKSNEKLELNTQGDNLMMARIWEELDMLINVKKEDRIILTGLTNSVYIVSCRGVDS